ncbi:RNA polymerase sigma factor [Parapedobacter sp. 10938]|uniref:RNA polymerase sigma factor n=1 Tax=Parapedobacter flavus TaxID=3110225 RepID=UPI002DBD4D83|nr:RNA polymerase sigma-70 factor [Parapedobacter sp. 10938]MEC3880513.1 RNA polymerase sigma-70 factor [Parapedobacter sp. 10938]
MMGKYNTMPDEELMDCVKTGDKDAFAELYQRYWPPLFLQAERMLQDDEAARDILQEVFLNIWQKGAELPKITTPGAYLYRMVRYQVIDRISSNRRHENLLTSFTLYADRFTNATDSAFDENELMQMITNEIKSMPAKMQEVFILSRFENLSHKEIANQLGISVATVKTHINNALHRVKKGLKLYFLLLLISHL